MLDPQRSLPPRPSLEQQRIQAKELLRALRAGDGAARDRFRRHLPDKPRLTLADAQFVIAREHGFDSWRMLKKHLSAAAEEDLTPEVEAEFRRAFAARRVSLLRELFGRYPAARKLVNAPLFPFDSPALVHFAGSGDVEMIELLLAAGADPNRRSDWWAGGFHALHSATPDAADRLISAGAVPDACAAAHLDRPEMLRRILDADASRVHERGGDGQTPLHFAQSVGVVDLLLDRGADIDARDRDHRATPAQWMLDRRAGAGRYQLARYLADRGAALDIFLAAALGLAGAVRSMLEADPTLLDLRTGQGGYGPQPPGSYHIYFWTLGQNRSPMQVAAQFGQQEVLELMRGRADPKSAFLEASMAARADEARCLLHDDPTLIGELAPEEHRVLADAGWAGDVSGVELMMELGFDPAAPGHDSGSALHCGAWVGSAECVRAILGSARGRAIVNSRDDHYNATPLGWCCHGAANCGSSVADHAAVAKLLLEAGAQPVVDGFQAPEPVREVIREFASRR